MQKSLPGRLLLYSNFECIRCDELRLTACSAGHSSHILY